MDPFACSGRCTCVDVYVDGGEEIVSKDDYLKAVIVISENGRPVVSSKGKIKGRGNYTWNYPKKPYKIKFDEKQSVFGFPENKDWVLLADYCDKSLMRLRICARYPPLLKRIIRSDTDMSSCM
jgi:hypothetical protein